MAKITVEDYDHTKHRDWMGYVDRAQRERRLRAGAILPRKVCTVRVCQFTFVFHSLCQLEMCLQYYAKEHHPTSKQPFDANATYDHEEAQLWFDRLPQYLLEKPKRTKVVAALQQGVEQYAKAIEPTKKGAKSRS